MKAIFLKLIFKLGLSKAAIKFAALISLVTTFFLSLLGDLIPRYFLGITIFLWLIYFLTVLLDWATGIKAARYIARTEKKDFKWDKDKATNSWFKHALFIIIIASIYNFQDEAIRKHLSTILIKGLTGIQLFYFAYSMIEEWISIENNRFVVSGKRTRLYKILVMILNKLDKGAEKKIDSLINNK